MKIIKKMVLTKEELKACEIILNLFYSDDDVFRNSEDLYDFLNTVTKADVAINHKAVFKSMEIGVEE